MVTFVAVGRENNSSHKQITEVGAGATNLLNYTMVNHVFNSESKLSLIDALIVR